MTDREGAVSQTPSMTISRAELAFDFGQAAFDLKREWDRKFLAWVFHQFLYGEVTGIQCGHWLYHSPSLRAAMFVAKQASEELAHVKKIRRILSLLDERPAPPHWAIRFLATGMMGGDWAEHVALEMALGEGLVLSAFYAMADTIPQPEIKRLLESAITEEERHVAFGERETRDWLKEYPRDRERLLAQAWVQQKALGALKNFLRKRLLTQWPGPGDHPVLSRFDGFYEKVLWGLEQRATRIGLVDRPIRELSTTYQLKLAFIYCVAGRFRRRQKKLTETYLSDPWVTLSASEENI